MTITDTEISKRPFPFNRFAFPKRLKRTSTDVAALDQAYNNCLQISRNCLQISASFESDQRHYNYQLCVNGFLENYFYVHHYKNGSSLIDDLADIQVNKILSKKNSATLQSLMVRVSPVNLESILSTTMIQMFGYASHQKNIRNRLKEWLLCFTISYRALLFIRSCYSEEDSSTCKKLVETTTIGLAVCLMTCGCQSTLCTLKQLRKFMVCFDIPVRRIKDGKSVFLNLWKKGIKQSEAVQDLIDYIGKHNHNVDKEQEADVFAKFHDSLIFWLPGGRKQYKITQATLRNRKIENFGNRKIENLIFPALGVSLYQMILARRNVKEFLQLRALVLPLIHKKRALPATPVMTTHAHEFDNKCRQKNIISPHSDSLLLDNNKDQTSKQKGEEQVSNCTEQQESQTLPLCSPTVTESEQSQAKQDSTIFRYKLHDSTLCQFAETVARSIHQTLSTNQASTASAVSRTRNTKGGTPYVNTNGCNNPCLPRIHHNTCYFYEHHQCEKVSRSVTKKMAVLTDRANPVSISNCVQSSDVHGCNDLFKYIRETQNPYCDGLEHNYHQPFAGNFHLQCKRWDHISNLHFYDYHRDKKIFPFVTFIPLRSSFYTILCVPNGFFDDTLKAFSDDVCLSEKRFQEMRDNLNKGDQGILDTYIKNMRQYAKREYCGKETQIIFFHCQPGSALSFEAWRFVHGTVTVDADDAKMRDLLIIHEFQGK